MTAMASRRFLNPAQPQTLVIAVYLLYLQAGFTLFYRLVDGVLPLLFLIAIVGGFAAGYLIANEKKIGYGLGIAMAFYPFFLNWYYFGNPLSNNLINLMFEIALVALLLHPQSRDYQRIWFK